MVGRPGLVARVDRCKGLDDGRLVVLEHRAGRISALIGSDEPVEAWHGELMGAPLQPGRYPTWELYLPDDCLTPVGSMNADQVRELQREHALAKFDDALADLRVILSRPGRDVEALADDPDGHLERAGQQALLERALSDVAMGTALFEVGFRPVATDQDLMRWVIGRPTDRLRFEAIQEPFGLWQLSCYGATRSALMCEEAQGLAEGRRGDLLVPLLRLWRHAYPGQATPPGLTVAEMYLNHRQGGVGTTGSRPPLAPNDGRRSA